MGRDAPEDRVDDLRKERRLEEIETERSRGLDCNHTADDCVRCLDARVVCNRDSVGKI